MCGPFSSCRKLGLPASGGAGVSHHGGFSCGAQALDEWAPAVVARGLVVRRHVESFWIRDQTYVPFIVRWVLNHLTTKEVLSHLLNKWD